jgi:hypothetical protein
MRLKWKATTTMATTKTTTKSKRARVRLTVACGDEMAL